MNSLWAAVAEEDNLASFLRFGSATAADKLTPLEAMPRNVSNAFLERVLLALGALGILVVVHLGIQQSRGFDQGCLGFLAPGGVEAAFDCGAVLQSGAGTFLGLSNTLWGLLFYGGIVGATLLGTLLGGRQGQVVRKARAGMLAAGLAYSAYLVYYQFAVIDALCALCLTSAGIVLLLGIIQGVLLTRERRAPVQATAPTQFAFVPMKELRYAVVLGLALVILVGADFAYFNRLSPKQALATVSGTRPAVQSQPSLSADCSFDATKQPVTNYRELLGVHDPSVGDPQADVTVMEFFDPNCPHCKTMHSVMEEVIAEYGDQAHFVYKPVALWQYSVPQIEALYAADQEGKFEEMLEKQFEYQKQGGLSMEELRQIAGEIGMEPGDLQQRIERGIYRSTVMEQRQMASDIGLSGVPTVLVNGRFVDSRSKTAECMALFIEEAAV